MFRFHEKLGPFLKPAIRRERRVGTSICQENLLGGLCTQQFHFLPELFRGVLSSAIYALEDLANLDFAIFLRSILGRTGNSLDPFDCLFQRLYLPQPESRDQFLGFSEGPVRYDLLASGESYSHTLRARHQPFAG